MAEDHQARWQQVAEDPQLQDLPYQIETNEQGQIALSPRKNRHSVAQEQVQRLLEKWAPDGRSPTEFAIATPEGVKVAVVIWMSPARWDKMQETGDPTTLTPEICVEVMSETNTSEDMHEKRALYLAAGAEEI